MKQKIVLSEHRKGQISLAIITEAFKTRSFGLNLSKEDVLKSIGHISSLLSPFNITKKEVALLFKDIISGNIRDLIDSIMKDAFAQTFWKFVECDDKTPALSNDRKLIVATHFCKLYVRKEELSLDKNDFLRRFGNIVDKLKSYEITKEELLCFYQEISAEALEDIFEQKITLET